MKKYLQQLLADIDNATQNVPNPYYDEQAEQEIFNWVSPEEEERTAVRKSLEEWTGIKKEQLPPEHLLTDEQIHLIYPPLEKMLNAYNMAIVFQIEVPERLKYKVLQQHFEQELPMLRWGMGFFELCQPETTFEECVLKEYCHCKFFKAFFADMVEENLTPEEERKRHLDIEVSHIKRKYGHDYMKYYPYHLDAEYDDENGNPYDYGFGNIEDDEDDEDNWWRK